MLQSFLHVFNLSTADSLELHIIKWPLSPLFPIISSINDSLGMRIISVDLEDKHFKL